MHFFFFFFVLFLHKQTEILHAYMQQPTHTQHVHRGCFVDVIHMTIFRQRNFFCINWVAVFLPFSPRCILCTGSSVVNWNLNAVFGNWPNSKPNFFRKKNHRKESKNNKEHHGMPAALNFAILRQRFPFL